MKCSENKSKLSHSSHLPLSPLADTTIKRRRVYVSGKEEVLTMLTSSQVPQQLMTRMVAIFLKECLGYVNLTITTVPDTFDPDRVIDEMRASKPSK